MALIRALSGSSGGGQYDFQANIPCPADFTFHCGFKPKQLAVSVTYTNGTCSLYYDENVSKTKVKRTLLYSGTYYNDEPDITTSMGSISLKPLNNDGFAFTGFASYDNVRNVYYLAVG